MQILIEVDTLAKKDYGAAARGVRDALKEYGCTLKHFYVESKDGKADKVIFDLSDLN